MRNLKRKWWGFFIIIYILLRSDISDSAPLLNKNGGMLFCGCLLSFKRMIELCFLGNSLGIINFRLRYLLIIKLGDE